MRVADARRHRPHGQPDACGLSTVRLCVVEPQSCPTNAPDAFEDAVIAVATGSCEVVATIPTSSVDATLSFTLTP